ncbi:MAG: hypothetical protein ABSH06_17820 [Thermodesulfobacteriota bacterium]
MEWIRHIRDEAREKLIKRPGDRVSFQKRNKWTGLKANGNL